MKIFLLSLISSLFFSFGLAAQNISRMADMLEPVTNQAITSAKVNGQTYVYSFAGLDESKLFSGIHKKTFKYDVLTNTWTQLAPLPFGNGRIAAGASFVKGKIYIIGGYEVFADDTEVSVDLVHVFDPASDTFLEDVAPIPVPIDDHVQAVWRDSLIYVVTGWSNDTNVPNVQIYNPSQNEWMVGTAVPDNNTYKVFGSSGVIVGDTIYYAGGAKISGGSFGFSNIMRKGVINPDQPTEIIWSHKTSFDAIGYRMGAATWDDTIPLWIGGSEDAYNYDGISYNTGKGVSPYQRILQLNPVSDDISEMFVDLPIMDNREVAQVSPTEILICGGIGLDQKVSANTYSVDVNYVNVENTVSPVSTCVYPSPTTDRFFVKDLNGGERYEILSLIGNTVQVGNYQPEGIKVNQLHAGIYFLKIYDENDLRPISLPFVKQ